ncbi:hypothetical protein NEUTE2DRAFT_142852, partial [Neurospora tetrasperma FGSC 2509]
MYSQTWESLHTGTRGQDSSFPIAYLAVLAQDESYDLFAPIWNPLGDHPSVCKLNKDPFNDLGFTSCPRPDCSRLTKSGTM